MKNIFIFFFIIIATIFTRAQQDTLFTIDEFENYFDNDQLDEEDSQLYDLFEYLINNPVDINNAGVNEILTIPTTDLRTARAIISYRNEQGNFNSIFDLNLIDDLSNEDVEKILPFIKAGASSKEKVKLFSLNEIFKNIQISCRSRTSTDLQNKIGFTEGKYSGSSLKNYNRMQVKYADKLSLGLLIEKDAGEKSFTDFSSIYFQARNLSLVNNIIIGDFLFESGQGLAMWSPYAFSKGSSAIGSTSKKARNIIPYTSADENQFMRGLAVNLKLSDINLTAFYSNHKIDANVDSTTNLITSTPLDGYHRTQSELLKKKRVAETILGIGVKYSHKEFLTFEGLYYHSSFSNSHTAANVFKITGDKFNFYSISYRAQFAKLLISGEFAYNGSSVASYNNIVLFVDKYLSITSSVRNYPRNFVNLHSNGFGESGGTQNEFGVYTGLKWKTILGTINAYYDQFKFPFATYYNPLPSTGHEYLIHYEVRPFAKTTFVMKYKNEDKETAAVITGGKILIDQIKESIRFDINYDVSKNLSIRSRIEFMNYRLDKVNLQEKGFLIFQDLKYKPYPYIYFYGRIIFFQTDSYNSRIYEFENDLTGVMTNQALYGKGMKWYFLVKYKPAEYITLTAKYSELYKPDERTLGTGLSEIDNNIDNKISVQIDIFL